MKMQKKIAGIILILFSGGLLWLAACEQDIDPVDTDPKNNPAGQDDPGNPALIDPDEALEYLVLDSAIKIEGNLPPAPDQQLKINFKDTIYLVKDFPYGARVVVKHDGLFNIGGFFVSTTDGSFYYDLPVEGEEAQDSSDVIYLNIELPDDFQPDFPYTIPVTIQPHDQDGIPLDEFNKWLTVEDPEGSDGCPVTIVRAPAWEWEFTVGINYAGEVFQTDAPGLKQISRYESGGCCNNDGTSTTVANDPYCTQNSIYFRSINVEHYYKNAFELLYLFEDGTFKQWNASGQTNYRPSKSDFCNNQAAYDMVYNEYTKYGKHDFSPGADYLNITYDVTDPPVFGKIIGSGEILYTCHSLILTVGREEKWSIVYRKLVHDHDPLDFAPWD
jgi:hypothetical protein